MGGSVPNFPTAAANDDFGPVIRAVRVDNKITRKVIGNIAGVGTETVKAWERGRQKPQSEHLFRMARTIPSVRRWTLRQLGVDQMPEVNSPQFLSAVAAAVVQVASQAGPDQAAARALLSGGDRI